MSNINVNNITPVAGTLLSVSGSLHVSGNLSANGTLTLGDENTDNIALNAEFTSSLIPNVDDQVNIGSSAKQWKDLYVDGTGYIDTQDNVNTTHVTASGNISASGTGSFYKVGIGTNSPEKELEVIGDISASYASTGSLGSLILANIPTVSTGDIMVIDSSGVVKKSTGIISVSGSSVFLTGSFTVSGSSTFTNWGNFRNRLIDNRAFEVSTNPRAVGGYRYGMVTPVTGSAPHLHFMLSGSGQTGIGLLNPQHTLHVSSSSKNWKALYVQGKSQFVGNITSSGNLKVIGNISSSQTISGATGSFAYIKSHLIPGTKYGAGHVFPHIYTPQYDLGSSNEAHWRNLFVQSASIYNGDITSSGNISASGTGSFSNLIASHLPTVSTGDILVIDSSGVVKKSTGIISVSGSSVVITGSLTISGSSTFTNFGNFRNRFPQDNRAFEVSTDPTAVGGFREGLVTPNTGSAPHLHFMLSGSGQTGIGLLNPQHTLHVSSSSRSWNALYVQGKSQFVGNITASFINWAQKTGGDISASGDITAENFNVNNDILPISNITSNLGSSTQQWRYLSLMAITGSNPGNARSTTHIQSAAVTASVHLVPDYFTVATGNPAYNTPIRDLGSPSKFWRSLYAHTGSFMNIEASGSLDRIKVKSDIDMKTHATAISASQVHVGKSGTPVAYVLLDASTANTASIQVSSSITHVKLSNLPTSWAQASARGSGSLFLSGSTAGGGKFLCVV